jgi:hypothetical protein
LEKLKISSVEQASEIQMKYTKQIADEREKHANDKDTLRLKLEDEKRRMEKSFEEQVTFFSSLLCFF